MPRPITQPWPIRLAHWVNVVALVVMTGSGLQILAAFPSFGPRGQTYAWYPWAGHPPPSFATLGGWLAGGRHWHFAFAWILVGNAAVYLVYSLATGQWRRRMFSPRRDADNAVQTMLYYLQLRRAAPAQGFYNGLQRLSYSMALGLGAAQVATGLAIYKPVQLAPLVWVFGGYDSARVLHFLTLLALLAFTVLHIALVSLHPHSLPPMLTGRESKAKDAGER